MWPKSSGNLPKIIIISGKNPLSEAGGYASYAFSLAKSLNLLGFSCQIFCCGKKDQFIKTKVGQIQVVGSKLLTFPFFENLQMTALLVLAPKLAFAIKQRLDSDKTTIIWGVGPWTLAGAILKLLPGKKKVILLAHYATSLKHEFQGTLSALTVKDYGLKIRLEAILAYLTIIQLYSLLERFLLVMTDKIITHYSSTERILIKEYQIKPLKFYRLPYSIEIVKKTSFVIRQWGIHINKPLILLICRQDPRKGINFLLHAIKLLQNRNLIFQTIIIGDGKMLKPNRKLAERLHLKNVFFPGFIANLSSFLKQATIYAFPSVEEGNSAISVLEAMQRGLPIVSTNVDGLVEDLEDGKSALLVPARNPEALADSIQKIIKNPKLAKRLSAGAKISFNKKHNKKLVRNTLMDFLASLESKQSWA